MPICSNGHRYNLKIDKGLASSGKNLNGWYYGFKLHMIINHNMDIVELKITDAKTKDIVVLDEYMVRNISGILIGDKGYIGFKKKERLSKVGVKLVTKSRKNMKKYPMNSEILKILKKRMAIETVLSKLKHHLNMINRYSRSLESFFLKFLLPYLLILYKEFLILILLINKLWSFQFRNSAILKNIERIIF